MIAAPPRTEQPVQLIDARDLAAFAVRCLEESITGTYNAVGPRDPLTLGGMITALAATFGVEVTLDHAVQTMAQRKPLVIDDPVEDGGFQVSGAAAYDAGLTLTPLDESARSVLVWERRRGSSPR